MKYTYLTLIGLSLILFSCSKNDIVTPPYSYEMNLENTLPVPDSVMRYMEGIYKLSDGSDKLGVEFVCKVSKRRVSFFSDKEGIFMILKYGLNPEDSSLQFAGFWRYSQTATQGNIGFSISKNDGAYDLIQNKSAANIRLTANFLDAELISRTSAIQFSRHFTDYAKNKDFAIIGHHGVQTTANPPFADNSIDAVLNVEDYGANTVELDVRMTKDNVPILIHDATINTRLTLKGPLTGDWDQYDFSTISEYVRLRDGQKVPSVEQILDAFVESTNLKYIILDIKGNKGIFKYLEPIIRNAYAKAAALNRKVIIYTDIPSEEVLDEYKTQPSYADLPIMYDLSLQVAIDNDFEAWMPRYSEGLMLDEVDRAHSLGKKVYSWTLNERKLVTEYVQNGKFDGLLSDYPAYIVYDFYTLY